MPAKTKNRRKSKIDPKRHHKFVRVTNQTILDLPKTESVRRLIVAVREVRSYRQMNAYESPECQGAWDRLQLAVLEAERVLQNKT